MREDDWGGVTVEYGKQTLFLSSKAGREIRINLCENMGLSERYVNDIVRRAYSGDDTMRAIVHAYYGSFDWTTKDEVV